MPWYETAWNAIKDFFVNNWTTILIFIAVLIFGFIVVKILIAVFSKLMKKSKLNSMAAKFLVSIVKIFLYIIYLIALLSLLGIPTTSLVALVSVGALAISLAVQNVISNFASGIEIVVTKPFVEGDLVEIDGITGNVDRITITNTRILTPDKRTVTIPNSKISTNSVINYTTHPIRRVDLVISVEHGSDVEKVKAVIEGVITGNERVLKDPAPQVRLNEHNTKSLDFVARGWSNNEDYWDVYFDLHEQILAAFAENGIAIPVDKISVKVDRTADNGAAVRSATAENLEEHTEQPAGDIAPAQEKAKRSRPAKKK